MKMQINDIRIKEDEDKQEDKQEDNARSNIWLRIDKIGIGKLSKEKKEKVIIIFLLGIFFLLMSTPISSFSKKKDTSFLDEKEIPKGEVIRNEKNDEYIEMLENKLEQTIGGIEGAGKVLVMITLKNNGEKILDKNQSYESSSETLKEEGSESNQSDTKSEPETVLVEQDGNTGPIVIQELYPDIEGVVVVCEGGENSNLSLRIKEAVQALFSVDAHKIVVCKLEE